MPRMEAGAGRSFFAVQALVRSLQQGREACLLELLSVGLPALRVPFEETVDETLAVAEIGLADEPSEGGLQIQEIALGRRVQNAKNTRGSEAASFGGFIRVSLINQDVCFQLLGQGDRVDLALVQLPVL